ncbi:MAG: penicillin-binding protein 1C [Flavobacteriales bacterium]
MKIKRLLIGIKTNMQNHPKKVIFIFLVSIIYYFILPKPLFKAPTSTVITSRNGHLLGARIAKDGQWRFPKSDSIPKKFAICITQFEDAYFYKHFGFNPISISKAFYQNFKAKKVVRGGSTITQQVIRLSRKGQGRTVIEKIKELVLATRVECAFSKDEILNYYASYAPFGGNVVGLEAASWRYFNRSSFQLSWAEMATLAVLPNAPSLIFPGRNQEKLLRKRNNLLNKLEQEGFIDSLTLQSALLESLPQKPYPLPQLAPHLLTKVELNFNGLYAETTINKSVQIKVNSLVKQHHESLSKNGINNGAVLVLDVKSREILAYVGNTPTSYAHHKHVDNILSARSTGSILKPFLYAGAFSEGLLLPNQLIKDIPTQMANFSPQNFDETYSGLTPASEALSRSLNIPAVRWLQKYNLHKFYDDLKQMNFSHFNKPADHYGLSLILGGGECSLWDITKNYAALTSTLHRFDDENGLYAENEFCDPVYLKHNRVNFGARSSEKILYDASSIYETFKALKLVNRPKEDQAWQYYNSSHDIAWKTGTSYGFKDGWAVGSTEDYVVGVWIGNSDGEGKPGITGVLAAAPLMFDVFDALPLKNSWTPKPEIDYRETEVCEISGFIAQVYCPKISESVPKKGIQSPSCPYHKRIHLNEEKTWQVKRHCKTGDDIVTEDRFVLPPLVESYYKSKHPLYRPLPPFHPSCNQSTIHPIDFVYPLGKTSVYLPRNRYGERTDLVLSAVHRDPKAILFWYIDEQFAGETHVFHSISVKPKKGKHTITIVDQFGEMKSRKIVVKN